MNESFVIEEDLLNEAKDICKYADEENVRIRVTSNVLATKIAEKIFSESFADRESGLHNISQLIEQYDIADIYFNNAYIDVRACIDENVLLVPKEHFEYGILPKAYMFISFSEDLNEGYLLGFVTPDKINKSSLSGDYYIVNKEDLISYYDVFTFINENNNVKNTSSDNFEEQIYEFLNGNISNFSSFMNELISNEEYRKLFIRIARAEQIFRFVSEVDEGLLETDESDETETNVDLENEAESDMDLQGFNDIEDGNFLDIVENQSSVSDILEENSSGDSEFLLENGTFDSSELDILSDVSDDIQGLQDNEASEYLPEAVEADISNEIPDFVLNTNDVDINSDATDNATDSIANSFGDNDYSTNTEPSLQDMNLDFMDLETVNVEVEDVLNDLSVSSDMQDSVNIQQETNISEEQAINAEQITGIDTDKSEEIEALFVEDVDSPQITDNKTNKNVAAKKGPLLAALLLSFALLAGGFYIRSQSFMQRADNNVETQNDLKQAEIPTEEKKPKEEAMPIETIENVKPVQQQELSAESVPYIEKNIDTSVVISNLHVDWEVPVGYTSNVNAKRYLTKLGKILQLNLKTELMLQPKTPITNKISVELQFNKNTQKFEVKQIIASSQETEIDNVIKNTIDTALGMNISTNMSVFNNIAGNPILVIHL